MKRLCWLTNFLLFALLFLAQVLVWPSPTRAQYGTTPSNNGRPQLVEGAYDYVAEIETEWIAAYGAADGSGDWRHYRNPIFDAEHTEQIGYADGYCIQTAPGEWAYCTWSLYADTWTLSAHGALDENTGENRFAIAGGTGEYEDVHGYLHWATNEAGDEEYFTVEEQEIVAYDPLYAVVDAGSWKATNWDDPATTYGNVWYWYDPLYDETHTEEIGATSGYCIWTAPNKAAECTWTAWGEDWALSASGVKLDEGKSWLSITGGYGAYAGATGTVGWETSSDGSQFRFDYHFDHLPTTLAKPYEVTLQPYRFYADAPPTGDSAGDVYFWHTSLWDAAQTQRIGYSDGYCIITATEAWSMCTLTFYTEHWTLTASGPAYESGATTQMAVAGGTGAYGDVSGHILVTPNADSTLFTVAFDIAVAPYTYWQAVAWEQVEENEIPFWSTLGWNETNWDGSHPAAVPSSESRTWAELTSFEQEAATAVGYDESTWNPSTVRVPSGDVNAFWNSLGWDDLYLSEQRLWGILGWDADNWSGLPEAAMPFSNWRAWAELTPVEQGAATELGYDETTWNTEIVRTPEGEVEIFWSKFAWEELYLGEQQLFAYLGWSEASWLGDQPIPESKYRTWEQLSAVERGAATQLSYDETNWNATVLEH